jgi:hypothetical protein
VNKRTPPVQSTDSLALAGVAGQAGCVTLIVVIAALVAGLWLDNQLGTRPIVTILLVLASVPVSLYLMIRTVLDGMARFHAARGNQPMRGGEPLGGMWRTPQPGDKTEDIDNDSAEGGRRS